MAEHMMMAIRQRMILCALAGLLSAPGSCAFAQALIDPTRPPDAMTAGDDSLAIAPSGPVLQSVLISPRRVEAIISGRTVKVGDKVGDAKVIRIKENEVTLRSGNDVQVLRLFPTIEKQPHSGRAGATVNSRRQ